MSPRFEPSDIDAVRERADIVEVVSDHVRLRKAGRSYKGLCPFHQEKTPSFTVDRDRGLFYCFGCQSGGSVFNFVERVENLSFSEAVDTLARRYGVELRETAGGGKQVSARTRLQALHEAAVEQYMSLLNGAHGGSVRAYLDERGVDGTLRERYRVGFGGWTRDGLVRVLLRKGFTGEELLASGLATREGRALRDTFFGRVLFPIFDPADHPIGFGGRVLPEPYRRDPAPQNPKYLNSRESPLFHKSRVLYGVNWARGDVLRERRLVVVEGYTDVIALHAAGVPEAVATCGTSLTEQHMQEISRRFGDVRVVLCLDADAAGQAAVSRERTGQLAGAFAPGETTAGGWLPVGKGWLPEVYVATLPEGQDPADYARSSGEAGVRDVLDRQVPLVEFLLRRSLFDEPLSTPEDRARAVRKGAEVLSQVGDSLLRHEYALWLADRVGVEAYEVSKVVEARAGRTADGRREIRPQQARIAVTTLSGPHRVEREALRALVASPHLFSETPVVDESDFTLPLHRSLLRLVRSERETSGRVDAGRLADRVQDDELRRTLTELAVGDLPDDVAGREMLLRLKEFALGRHIEECKGQLRKLDPDREAAAYDALFEKLLELEKDRRSLIGGT